MYGPPAPAYVTLAGADWLASASAHPRSVHALWADRPSAPTVLPCGTAFDVISAPVLFGRRMLDRLWADGPGSGPVAVHRDRVLLFTVPGASQRLPALLGWEEWGARVPPLLCLGAGDAVTVPALFPSPEAPGRPAGSAASRWLVAPEVGAPWLPGPEVLIWACIRAARGPLAEPADEPQPPNGEPHEPTDEPAAPRREAAQRHGSD
ncbi:bifunctional DNA primase/polymerase [Streptomyces sp. MST-110588]|uniref:bifunctional DNA primase/polymerase n=1 Tax=Streptomyces sp. MST-110588 TaxID=2833628 RepID=UPI001F5D4FA3|nr:bifunctional DNA primase/polymerase [Streptomyces sp. MST-110588]